MNSNPFSQEAYACRLVWGRRGARDAAARGDILVIVDVLSFSTAVATAVAGGAVVIPCADGAEAAITAAETGAVAAVGRYDVPRLGRFSLSPVTFLGIEPGVRVALGSPNGAACSRHAREASHLFVGALVNATAVAAAAMRTARDTGKGISVVACGERWETEFQDEGMRVAIEDALGAGAILSRLDCKKSPEALWCEGSFLQLRDDLHRIIADCGSGRELLAKGFGEDVGHASRLDLYDAVPFMRDGALTEFGPG